MLYPKSIVFIHNTNLCYEDFSKIFNQSVKPISLSSYLSKASYVGSINSSDIYVTKIEPFFRFSNPSFIGKIRIENEKVVISGEFKQNKFEVFAIGFFYLGCLISLIFNKTASALYLYGGLIIGGWIAVHIGWARRKDVITDIQNLIQRTQ
jgi:hypothetical protein